MPDFISHLELRLRREFAAAVDDWGRAVTALSAWEDEHLLDDPKSDALARHKQTIERLLRFGQFLAVSAHEPELNNGNLASNIEATIHCLQDKVRLWHGADITSARRAEILAACFNES